MNTSVAGNIVSNFTDSIVRTDYFPTMIFQLDIEDHRELNKSLTSLIYAERERDQIGVNKSNTAQLGSWHSHTALQKQPEYAELLAHINFATEPDFGGAWLRDRPHSEGHLDVVHHQPARKRQPRPRSSRLHLERRLLHPGTGSLRQYRVCRSAHGPDHESGEISPEEEETEGLLDQGELQANARTHDHFPELAVSRGRPEHVEGNRAKADRTIISFNISQVKE